MRSCGPPGDEGKNGRAAAMPRGRCPSWPCPGAASAGAGGRGAALPPGMEGWGEPPAAFRAPRAWPAAPASPGPGGFCVAFPGQRPLVSALGGFLAEPGELFPGAFWFPVFCVWFFFFLIISFSSTGCCKGPGASRIARGRVSVSPRGGCD